MREKLIELIRREVSPPFAERIADHLIEGGVVIPVRCKDCKHWHEDTLSCDFTPHSKYYERPNWYEEDFCSYGERKDVWP